MMKTTAQPGSWRALAATRIHAAAQAWLEAHGLEWSALPYLDADQQRDLLQHLSAAYPFGQRRVIH